MRWPCFGVSMSLSAIKVYECHKSSSEGMGMSRLGSSQVQSVTESVEQFVGLDLPGSNPPALRVRHYLVNVLFVRFSFHYLETPCQSSDSHEVPYATIGFPKNHRALEASVQEVGPDADSIIAGYMRHEQVAGRQGAAQIASSCRVDALFASDHSQVQTLKGFSSFSSLTLG